MLTPLFSQGDKAIRGEEEDIPSIIFPAQDDDRRLYVGQAAYLRIFGDGQQEDHYNVKNVTVDVPKGLECEVIGGKRIKFC